MAFGPPYIADRRLNPAPDADETFPFDRVEGNRIFNERTTAGTMKVLTKTMNEWVADIDGGAEQTSVFFDTRTDAAASSSIPVDINVIRTYGYTTIGDRGGGLYQREASEPTHEGKFQSADGTWWSLVVENNRIYPEQFGAVGDADFLSGRNGLPSPATIAGWTDDATAFTNMLAYVWATCNPANYWYKGGYDIYFDVNKSYYTTATLEIKGGACNLRGGGSFGWTNSSQIIFGEDVTGIRVQGPNTSLEIGTSTPNGGGAAGTIIEGLNIRSIGGTNLDRHGIRARSRVMVSRCLIGYFPGDGINLRASSGGGGSLEGNVNCSMVEYTRSEDNGGNGFYIRGGDGNAALFHGCDADGNAIWGFLDVSFLGNTYIGCHSANNGIFNLASWNRDPAHKYTNAIAPDGIPGHRVWYDGNFYCVVYGQEAAASTTPPGTDYTVWHYTDTEPTPPTDAWEPIWVSGTTYRACGPFANVTSSAETVVIGLYTEYGQAPMVLVDTTYMIGGLHNGIIDFGGYQPSFTTGAYTTRLRTRRTEIDPTPGSDPDAFTVHINDDPTTGEVMEIGHSDWVLPFRWTGNGTDFTIGWQGGTVYGMSAPNTAVTFGRSAATPYKFRTFDNLMIGNTTPRLLTGMANMPSSGSYAEGDVVIYNDPEHLPTRKGRELLFGWMRRTQGSTHVLDTDWMPLHVNIGVSLLPKTANYTITDNDEWVMGDSSGGAITITLPTVVSSPVGTEYGIIKVDSSSTPVYLNGLSTQAINGSTTDLALTKQWQHVRVQSWSATGTGNGTAWLIIRGGDVTQRTRVAANVAVTASTTLADVTGLSVGVGAGRTYSFKAKLPTTSDAAAGVKFAIAGTATATNIVYDCIVYNGATVAAQTRGTAMAAAVGGVTAVTAAYAEISGTITVNAAGTLLVQFAQNVSDAAASTVLRGASFDVFDIT
jgi:hypothetical protein